MVSRGRADLRGNGVDLSRQGGEGVFVVFNPASGRGGGARRIARWLDLLGRHLPGFSHAATASAGDEYRIADEALASGFHTLVAVGGDGTWSHVADRVLASGRSDVRFGVLPSGTGNDFGRNIGLDHRDPEACVRVLASGRTTRVDAGLVATPSVPAEPGRHPEPGTPRTRHFLNLVGFGFDVSVIDAAADARFLRGELLYKLTAAQELFRFPGVAAQVEPEGGEAVDGQFLMVTLSNGRFFGGGFPIAPSASVTDGRLHGCLIGDAGPLVRARLFGAAGKGRHVDAPQVQLIEAGHFRVRFPSGSRVRFEADGDVYEAEGNTLDITLLPGALEVLVP